MQKIDVYFAILPLETVVIIFGFGSSKPIASMNHQYPSANLPSLCALNCLKQSIHTPQRAILKTPVMFYLIDQELGHLEKAYFKEVKRKKCEERKLSTSFTVSVCVATFLGPNITRCTFRDYPIIAKTKTHINCSDRPLNEMSASFFRLS